MNCDIKSNDAVAGSIGKSGIFSSSFTSARLNFAGMNTAVFNAQALAGFNARFTRLLATV